MSNTPKPAKSGVFKRRALERAQEYERGYKQGQVDLMLNVAPETRKLTEEATAILLSTASNAREFGDRRLAFILENVCEWVGDPDLISKLTKESDNGRENDIANLA